MGIGTLGALYGTVRSTIRFMVTIVGCLTIRIISMIRHFRLSRIRRKWVQTVPQMYFELLVIIPDCIKSLIFDLLMRFPKWMSISLLDLYWASCVIAKQRLLNLPLWFLLTLHVFLVVGPIVPNTSIFTTNTSNNKNCAASKTSNENCTASKTYNLETKWIPRWGDRCLSPHRGT